MSLLSDNSNDDPGSLMQLSSEIVGPMDLPNDGLLWVKDQKEEVYHKRTVTIEDTSTIVLRSRHVFTRLWKFDMTKATVQILPPEEEATAEPSDSPSKTKRRSEEAATFEIWIPPPEGSRDSRIYFFHARSHSERDLWVIFFLKHRGLPQTHVELYPKGRPHAPQTPPLPPPPPKRGRQVTIHSYDDDEPRAEPLPAPADPSVSAFLIPKPPDQAVELKMGEEDDFGQVYDGTITLDPLTESSGCFLMTGRDSPLADAGPEGATAEDDSTPQPSNHNVIPEVVIDPASGHTTPVEEALNFDGSLESIRQLAFLLLRKAPQESHGTRSFGDDVVFRPWCHPMSRFRDRTHDTGFATAVLASSFVADEKYGGSSLLVGPQVPKVVDVLDVAHRWGIPCGVRFWTSSCKLDTFFGSEKATEFAVWQSATLHTAASEMRIAITGTKDPHVIRFSRVVVTTALPTIDSAASTSHFGIDPAEETNTLRSSICIVHWEQKVPMDQLPQQAVIEPTDGQCVIVLSFRTVLERMAVQLWLQRKCGPYIAAQGIPFAIRHDAIPLLILGREYANNEDYNNILCHRKMMCSMALHAKGLF